ncbi:ubiquinone biosynthesis O-methyltransferase-like isoform X2 [Hylaeus volcanicus]|uniref:ubiquinone biosynthesis O-methyltransferase-like isoform X2 n=1 Tax=Hylaeus volcanicus TaxID=313075 RepID=UPI0023B86149|nr:ubiquinone biosynthesis O-methyltransferase-like isoform X2 [Hylaeus volcanicus]
MNVNSMTIRVPFICHSIRQHLSKSIQECYILDAGCGGGYLAETLALKGATVLGIDTSAGAIEVAKKHFEEHVLTNSASKMSPCKELQRLDYKKYDIFDLLPLNISFDVIVASEVIEHIRQPANFLSACSKLLKPNGLLILTTPNRNFLSYLLIVFLGEYVLKLLPKNTHEYKMFFKPKELQSLVQRTCGLKCLNYTGSFYIPWPINMWVREPLGLVNYMMCFQKPFKKI